MKLVIRILAGLAGALGVFIALATWANPAGPPAQLGLQGVGALGEATIRADIAGFFGTFGVMAIAGAVRGEGRLFTAPMVLIGLALAGRVITVAMSGYAPEMGLPMMIEVGLLSVFGAGRFLLAGK